MSQVCETHNCSYDTALSVQFYVAPMAAKLNLTALGIKARSLSLSLFAVARCAYNATYFVLNWSQNFLFQQRASEQFSMLRRQGGGGESREDVLKKTAAAFDKYEELFAHLQVNIDSLL